MPEEKILLIAMETGNQHNCIVYLLPDYSSVVKSNRDEFFILASLIFGIMIVVCFSRGMCMEPLTTLVDLAQQAEPELLTPALAALYAGQLAFATQETNRPYIISNFVTTLDGVTSFGPPHDDTGNAISGKNEADHAIMGILRACADAVLWGAGSYNAARRFLSTPAAIWPQGAGLLAEQRASLGIAETPLAVIITSSGAIDFAGALLHEAAQPTLILTTQRGNERLAPQLIGTQNTEVRALSSGPNVEPADAARLLHEEYDVRLLLHEGGPTLFGSFLRAGLIDEAFFTFAPQFAGRDGNQRRPGMIEGMAFSPANAPWARLASLKRSGDHLFARYFVVGPR
jgi:riboflavin biosynthesis pyrimidine reductase